MKASAAQLVSEYWVEHKQDILDIVDGSFLEGYDEFNIGVQFRNAATVSITYSLLSRCGLEPEGYFDHEDFLSIFDFKHPGGGSRPGNGGQPEQPTGAAADRHYHSKLWNEPNSRKGASHMENT